VQDLRLDGGDVVELQRLLVELRMPGVSAGCMAMADECSAASSDYGGNCLDRSAEEVTCACETVNAFTKRELDVREVRRLQYRTVHEKNELYIYVYSPTLVAGNLHITHITRCSTKHEMCIKVTRKLYYCSQCQIK